MTGIKLIFRFHISEVVYPSVENIIQSEKKLNIISGNRIRSEFLKSGTEIAEKINYYIDNGKLIPTEYWCPFWTSMISEGSVNVFTSMIGDIKQFKEFERCLNLKKYNLTEIIYLKINEKQKLTEIAKQKYSKIYDDSDILDKRIDDYQKMRQEIIDYADSKYNVIEKDFFVTELKM